MCRLDAKFSQHSEIMWKRLGSQIITLNPKSHQYHVLNEAAALIFEQSTGNKSVEVIAKEFAKKFGIDKDQALQDTRETVDGMVKLGLLMGTEAEKAKYDRPSVREITEEDFKGAIASGAELAARSLLG